MTSEPTPSLVSACGLYCGSCPNYLKGKCHGCVKNEKATWCTTRTCCHEHGYTSCADCTLMPLNECKKFNNFMAKLFGFIFRSDRKGCIARIKEVGYEQFATEMHQSKCCNRPQTPLKKE